ncbi:unnamed protein product [marine sediment metagenome]|uniref:Uncharacterized protein n=1 Tax=marine sediment metagenome TaxID=412755 RepID=X0UNC9_9ZZZZ
MAEAQQKQSGYYKKKAVAQGDMMRAATTGRARTRTRSSKK